MNKLSKLFVQKSNIMKIVISGFLFLIITITINGNEIGVGKLLKITRGTNILGFSFGYSVQKAYNTFSKMGVNGRHYYLTSILPLDFIFPTLGALFHITILSFLLKIIKPKKEAFHNLIFIPLAGMLCDITENICIVLMLLNYPTKLINICKFSSIATLVKFMLSPLTPLLIVLLTITYIINRIKHNKIAYN